MWLQLRAKRHRRQIIWRRFLVMSYSDTRLFACYVSYSAALLLPTSSLFVSQLFVQFHCCGVGTIFPLISHPIFTIKLESFTFSAVSTLWQNALHMSLLAIFVRLFLSAEIKSTSYDNTKPTIDSGNDVCDWHPKSISFVSNGERWPCFCRCYFHNRFQQFGPTTEYFISLAIE